MGRWEGAVAYFGSSAQGSRIRSIRITLKEGIDKPRRE